MKHNVMFIRERFGDWRFAQKPQETTFPFQNLTRSGAKIHDVVESRTKKINNY